MSKAQGPLLHMGENKGMMSPGCKLGEHCPETCPLWGTEGPPGQGLPTVGSLYYCTLLLITIS